MDSQSPLTCYVETAADLARQLQEAEVDHLAFERPMRPCVLAECMATCCHDGVHVSASEARVIWELLAEHAPLLATYGDDLPLHPLEEAKSQGQWKTRVRSARDSELAMDYPKHFPRTRCVFLDQQHRCKLQRLAVDTGRSPWFYKPLTCWMHPILLRTASRSRPRPMLTLADENDDPQKKPGYPGFAPFTHCGRTCPDAAAPPSFDVLRTELIMLSRLSGRDFLRELQARPA